MLFPALFVLARARLLVTVILVKVLNARGRQHNKEFKMAEGKVRNLLRLSTLRDKYDAVILAIHACLVEKGFRCIGSGEEVNKVMEQCY
jgi:hypothetical protein